ncbi:MAG: tetratricopeptide repeat protein [Xanthobacteraceae bacterium]
MRSWLSALVVLVLAQPIWAEDFAACTAPDTKDDQRITACTVALSLAFENRGIAYFKKNDLERALADFNDALNYNNSLALALRYRSKIYWRRFFGYEGSGRYKRGNSLR